VAVIDPIRAVIWEAILTFFLMFVIIAVATDTRAVGTMAGLAIGAIVMLGAFVGGPLTGASMNPARSLAPALASGNLNQIWIYILGPMIGAVAAAKVYELIRCDSWSSKDGDQISAREASDAIRKEVKGCC
jgi:aquaporin NIP